MIGLSLSQCKSFFLVFYIFGQGDEILSVNGMDVRGKSAFEASSLLQGPNETFVSLEVMIMNQSQLWSVTVLSSIMLLFQ